jgi:hypothetical protein
MAASVKAQIPFKEIVGAAQKSEPHVGRFLRDLIATKSLSSQEENVIHRVEAEMEK